MKLLFSIVVYFFTSLNLSGQPATNNVLTPDHQNINGTKISLIAPKGFEKAANFLGFQQTQSGATIMVLDIPGPFAETSKAITKEDFLSQGVEVKTIEKLELNGLPAFFVTGEQNAHGNIYTKFVLVFGTANETILINGASPNNLQEIAKEIKTAMLTCFYDADKKINPFDALDYELDVSPGKLIFAKSVSNSLAYTSDGNLPTKSTDKTTLVVAKSFSKTVIEDKKLFALNRLKQLPIKITKIESTQQITIDDIPGYEIVASGKDKKTGNPEKSYQVILFSDSLYYIFYGSTNQDFDNNINELKKAVKTFRRK